MRNLATYASVLALSSTAAVAGGLDRSGQSINILFEKRNSVQFALSNTSPTISGNLAGTNSGDVGESFQSPSLGFKYNINDRWDMAVIYDEPFGAHITYDPNYFLSDPTNDKSLSAQAQLQALTALVRYKFNGGFSAYAGPRIQRFEGDVSVPILGGYTVNTDKSTNVGYVVGAAWEKPEIAARVALTYSSKITHDFSQVEGFSNGATFNTESEFDTPQSVNLDFQTGLNKKTLLFGTIRWVDWPQTVYSPPNYPRNPLVDYQSASTTYSLGVGRKITEDFSLALTVGYENATDEPVSNLGPTDGNWSVGVGGTYTYNDVKLSAGIRYTALGDATTDAGARFEDNKAVSAGFQVTYAFD